MVSTNTIIQRLMTRILALLAFAGAVDFGPANSACAQDAEIRAGAFAMDITPRKYPISINGGMQDRMARIAHDRLHARCLVLDDGAMKIAIAVCDSCMLPRELLDVAKERAAKATGIPTNQMLISATHTHTAPTVSGVFQSEPNKDYQEYLIANIAQGIEKAHANLQPAKIGWGVGRNATQVFNRRWKMKPSTIADDPFGRRNDTVKMNPGHKHPGLLEPAGPIDPDVSVLSIQTRDGKPLAVLANYSLHYVGGVQPVSADYFGAFADRIGQLLGADRSFVGSMSNGTSGNINNVNYAADTPARRAEFEQIKVVSESVAQSAFAALKQISYRNRVTLAMRESEISLGVRRPDATEIKQAQAILAAAKKPVLTTLPEIYARETVLMADYPATVNLKLQALRIGELGIVAIPCEVFVEIGLAIKNQSPLKPTFTIELANGYSGYLPTPDHHRMGGYETWRARSSFLEVDAATKIEEEILKILRAVK